MKLNDLSRPVQLVLSALLLIACDAVSGQEVLPWCTEYEERDSLFEKDTDGTQDRIDSGDLTSDEGQVLDPESPDTGSEKLEDDLEPSSCIVRAAFDAQAKNQDGASWETAYRDLEAAVAWAAKKSASAPKGRCEVWVKEGIYVSGVRLVDDIFLRIPSHVWLFGGFAGDENTRNERNPASHPTILSGARGGYCVVGIFPEERGDLLEDIVFDGFVVSDGVSRGLAGGMFIGDARVLIRNTVFNRNMAFEGGGALGVYLSDPSQDVEVRVEQSKFILNGPNVAVTAFPSSSKVEFVNSLFDANMGPVVTNVGAGAPDFTNCTFVRNAFSQESGLFTGVGKDEETKRRDLSAGARSIVNCVFGLNAPHYLFPPSDDAADLVDVPVYYSLYPPGALAKRQPPESSRDTCLEGSATFVDPRRGVFRLAEGSLGVDQGTSGKDGAFDIPRGDIGGKKRDLSPDMGAYER